MYTLDEELSRQAILGATQQDGLCAPQFERALALLNASRGNRRTAVGRRGEYDLYVPKG